MSTIEVEHRALVEAIKEVLWLEGIIDELSLVGNICVVFCDSQSTIHMSKNDVFHERIEYINVRLFCKRHSGQWTSQSGKNFDGIKSI